MYRREHRLVEIDLSRIRDDFPKTWKKFQNIDRIKDLGNMRGPINNVRAN